MNLRTLTLLSTFAVCAVLCALVFFTGATTGNAPTVPVAGAPSRADEGARSQVAEATSAPDVASADVSRRSIASTATETLASLARGRVVHQDGGGVASISVRFATVFAPHHHFVVVTDAAGRFELRGSLPSPAHFEISVFDPVDGHRAFERLDELTTVRLPQRSGEEALWLRVRELPRRPSMLGRLLDARDGSAVPDTHVELEHANSVLAKTVTAADGSFSFVRFAEHPVEAHVRVAPSAAHRGARFGPLSFDDVQRELRLEPALRLPIRVTTADTREPIERFRVRIRPIELPPDATADARTTSAPFVDGRCDVTDVWSGESMLLVVPDDPLLGVSDVLRVDPRDYRKDAPLEIVLPRLLPLRVHVRRSDARPRPNIEIELVRTTTFTRTPFATDVRTRVLAPRTPTLDRVPMIVSRATTDSDGACDLGVPADAEGLQLRVRKADGRYQITPIPVPAPRAFDLTFDAPGPKAPEPRELGRVEGQLRGPGTAAWRWSVVANRADEGPDDWPAQTPDEAGRFALEVPAGQYLVRATAMHSAPGGKAISHGWTPMVSCKVVAGETRQLTIDTPEPVRITGQVRYDAGELDGSEVVSLYTSSLDLLASTRVDATGRFEFSNVFPSAYRAQGRFDIAKVFRVAQYLVCLEAGTRLDRAVWNPDGTLIEADLDKTVDIDLRVRERFARITVRHADGSPAAFRRLVVGCGPVRDFVQTDADGRALVHHLPLRGRLSVLQTHSPDLELAEVGLQPDVHTYTVDATLDQPLRPPRPGRPELLIPPDRRNR